jgi:hypothetical protein
MEASHKTRRLKQAAKRKTKKRLIVKIRRILRKSMAVNSAWAKSMARKILFQTHQQRRIHASFQ